VNQRTETTTADATTTRMPDELDSRHLVRRLVALAVLLALVAALVATLPGLGSLRARFASADPLLLAMVGLCKLCSCLSNVVAFRDVFCPRMGWRFSYRLSMAEQATNVLLPTGGAGGLALGAWALHESGMSTEHIGRRSVNFFVLTSLPNFVCAAVLGPLLLAGVFAGEDPTVVTAIFTSLAWITMAVIVALPFLLKRIDRDKPSGRIVSKLRNGAWLLGEGIRDTGRLLTARRWPAILGAVGYLAFDIAALIVAYAAFGGAPPLGPLIFAYVIGQLGGLIPLPAGIGGTDGGMIGAMVLYGSSLSQATAAVLAYRAFQVGVPAVLGTIAFARLRSTLHQADEPGAACAPLGDTSLTPEWQAADGSA
jgi:uncharacterized membrane protein YbhN (UPF0104 family)